MSRPYKARNKRLIQRSSNGKFRKTTLSDIGLGVCSACSHFTIHIYFGENPSMPDPRQFGYLCKNCNVIRDQFGKIVEDLDIDKIIEMNVPKQKTMSTFRTLFEKLEEEKDG